MARVNGNGRPRKVGRPRTVRLPVEEEKWADEHVESTKDQRGFSGLVTDALRFYRGHVEAKGRLILDAIEGAAE